uniref:Uncharacterized protein n=1 Tax=Romanomermis culicivorax TaxID=13658 RepID=A0A915JHI5_ROMCU
MPLTKRCVSPIDVSLHRLPSSVRQNELECVSNGTLANLVRQMSSLSKHAEDIFGELCREAMKIEHKTQSFFNRIDRISAKVTQLDSNVDEVSLQDLHLRKQFKSCTLIDQQSLSRQTMPAAMAECYSGCDRPPELDKLNPYSRNEYLIRKIAAKVRIIH